MFIFIIPGMLSLALAKSGKLPALGQALLGPDGEVITANAQAAFPLMVQHVLPVGIRGIVVAGLLAALMSSLAGAFNACSTLFTMDLYNKLRPGASQHRLVWIGRRGDHGHGADRAALDPRHPGRVRPLQLPPGRCRATSPRRSSRCSSSASSSSG